MVVQVVTLAERVRELRQRTPERLSQAELSERVGVGTGYIAGLEAGRIQLPSADILRRLAHELGTTSLDLLEAAGYVDPAELDPVAALPDDPEYVAALRAALGISDSALREMVAAVIAKVAEVDAARQRQG